MSALDPAIVNLLKDSGVLMPAVVQDSTSHEVLMLAYMNTESLALTLNTGKATYFSRSRKEIWVKGATSGHFQEVQSVSLDCDGDALLIQVKQIGVACHTGEKTCFHKPLVLG
jgi:phosphoribosyl-AMP cyclohydrolase